MLDIIGQGKCLTITMDRSYIFKLMILDLVVESMVHSPIYLNLRVTELYYIKVLMDITRFNSRSPLVLAPYIIYINVLSIIDVSIQV